MFNKKSVTLKLVATAFLLLSLSWLANVAFEALNQPSDLSVFAGFVGVLVVIFGGIYALKSIWGKSTKRRKKTMKTPVAALLLMVIGFSLITGGCTKVPPGYVGIKVNQYGSQRGVEDFPLLTGKVWYNPFTEDVYQFPTFMQNAVWTRDKTEGSPNDDSITMNSIEGAVINADIALAYAFTPERVPYIFVEFKQDAETITWGYMRSQVRDAFSRKSSVMKVTEIFGVRKQELLEQVKQDLNERLGPKGFRFDMVSFVGALRVDEKVAASINAVLEASQRAIEAENKIRQSQAEAQQMMASAKGDSAQAVIRALGQAKANEVLQRSLTPALIQWQAISKWNGILPQVTSGATPFIQVPTQK